MRPRTRAVGRRFPYKLFHLESCCYDSKNAGALASLGAVFWFFSIANKRVNLCTVVIIAPSRVSVNVPLRKFEVVFVGPFAMVRLEEEQTIDEPVPDVPRPALPPVVVGLAAY